MARARSVCMCRTGLGITYAHTAIVMGNEFNSTRMRFTHSTRTRTINENVSTKLLEIKATATIRILHVHCKPGDADAKTLVGIKMRIVWERVRCARARV